MERTLIIAEIGECFNGETDTALSLMQAAKDAGCDFVKFQTLDSENIADEDPERDWFKKISLSASDVLFLKGKADEIGIDVTFTPENVKTAAWILEAGISSIKIASSSVGDTELYRYANDNFKTVFLSTGMASLEEVDEAVEALSAVGELYIMHCVSEYPTGPLLEQRGLKALSISDVRLNMMHILEKRYPQHKVGYSDHTDGILAPVAAVAAGAKIIEKHITLDRATPVKNFLESGPYLGTDHVLSIEPPELKEMVRQIRDVECMFGDERWERSEGEKILIEFLRGRFSSEPKS